MKRSFPGDDATITYFEHHVPHEMHVRVLIHFCVITPIVWAHLSQGTSLDRSLPSSFYAMGECALEWTRVQAKVVAPHVAPDVTHKPLTFVGAGSV